MINQNALKLSDFLIKNNYTISFAESMTGGLLVAELVKISGISKILNESYITYSEESKINILKVKKETISKYQVVSQEVCIEMLTGLVKKVKSNIGVVVTGYSEHPLFNNQKSNFPHAYIGIFVLENYYYFKLDFNNNDRISNLETTVQFVYEKLVELVIK